MSASTDEHLRVHMAGVRKKLRERGLDGMIATESGVGYRLVNVS